MAKFLTKDSLNEAIYDIIFNAKKELLIVSPYIKLDDYFRTELFDKHTSNADVKITIVFGKNKTHLQKSLNLSDFEYFKKFPNITIIHVPNLHAKYYANEKQGIITSMNLYDYSFKNNFEFAVLFNSKLIEIDKIYSEVWEETAKIIDSGNVIFVRKPQFKKKLLSRSYVGSITMHDSTDKLVRNEKVTVKNISEFKDIDDTSVTEDSNRISRTEFEKEEKAPKKKVKPKSNTSNNGFCIKCNTKIKDNPKVPFCKTCYSEVKIAKELKSIQTYCHLCGKKHNSSLEKPVCYSCYKKYKNKYNFSV